MFFNDREICQLDFLTIKIYCMNSKINNLNFLGWLIAASLITMYSCNKAFDGTPAPTPPPTGQTIADIIGSTPSFSILNVAVNRAGLGTILGAAGNQLTLFAPDDDAFALSGIDSNVIKALPVATVQALLNYHVIPQNIPSANIPTTFPNVQMPTLLQLDPTNPLVRMTIFPSRRDFGVFVNNIPVKSVDLEAVNGVIHTVAAVVNPPSQVLAQIIYGDTSLAYFSAAVARADSGQVGLNRIDSLLKYPVVNMTVLAPNNAAFQTLLFGQIYSALLAQGLPPSLAAPAATALSSSPDVFSNPALYSVLTAATVRGIVVYHILTSPDGAGSYTPNARAFSVNFSTDPGVFVTTLVNTVFPSHPGIMTQATFTGPVVSSLNFTGLGSFPPSGVPYSGPPANTLKMDEHAVNGVVHVLDQVLLPQ